MKIDREDIFERELGDKLGGLREEPPAALWERIESTLATIEAAPIAPSPKEVVPTPLWNRLWVRGVVATLAAAVALVAIVLPLRRGGIEGATAEGYMLCSNSLTLAPPTAMVAEATLPLVALPEEELVVEALTLPQSDLEEVVALAEPTSEDVHTPREEASTRLKGRKQNPKSGRTTRRTTRERDNSKLSEYWRSVIEGEPRRRSLANPTQIGFYVASAGANRGDVQKENVAYSPMLVQEQSNLGGGTFMGPVMANQEVASKLEHQMPTTMGLTVSYALNHWLALESGLLYTSLTSHSESAGALSRYEVRRSMEYLGVPLALSFNVVNFNRLGFYGRVGLTGELSIAANDRFYLDGKSNKTESLIVDRPFTLSLDAAAGVNVALVGSVNLFGEVGCSYWNAPDGYPENYRTIHPLSLSTRFGLKFMFE